MRIVLAIVVLVASIAQIVCSPADYGAKEQDTGNAEGAVVTSSSSSRLPSSKGEGHILSAPTISSKPPQFKLSQGPRLHKHVHLALEQAAAAPAKHTPCHFDIVGRWKSPPSTIYYHAPSVSDMNRQMLQMAWETWANEVPTKLPRRIEWLSTRNPPAPTRNDRNEIAFLVSDTSFITDKTTIGDVLSETSIWKDPETNEIVEVDILFHPNVQDYDLLSLATAEFGSMLGLGHSLSYDHTMSSGTFRYSNHKRSLECGDQRGIRALYPSSST